MCAYVRVYVVYFVLRGLCVLLLCARAVDCVFVCCCASVFVELLLWLCVCLCVRSRVCVCACGCVGSPVCMYLHVCVCRCGCVCLFAGLRVCACV